MKLASLIKSFTAYQICYLSAVVLISASFIILMPEMMLRDTSNLLVLACSVICVLANPLCELLIAKQSKLNFIVDMVLIEIPQLILCLHLGLYSVAAVTILFWVPIDIISYAHWTKHPDAAKEEETAVRKLSPKQDVLSIFAIILFTFAAGGIMRRIPGAAESYLDALSAACGMANGILLAFRYSEQWYAWFITLILYTVLYIRTGAYIMLVTVGAMFVNTCYGYVKWRKYVGSHKAG